jgi:hypothetical protein
MFLKLKIQILQNWANDNQQTFQRDEIDGQKGGIATPGGEHQRGQTGAVADRAQIANHPNQVDNKWHYGNTLAQRIVGNQPIAQF